MCTSFVLYSDRTYIGMNFDISDRPIKLSMRGADQLLVFQRDGPSFFPAFGINSSGTFVNLLMADPNEAGKYRRGKNCVHIMRVFDDVLGGQASPVDLSAYLRDKTVVNVPNISVHSMVAGSDRCAYVIEPGRTNISFDSTSSDFLVLTNFPLSDFVGRDYRDVTGSGADRYKTCYRMLSESKHAFDVDQGFAILEETSQSGGDYPTQLSMLAIPEDGIVHFAIENKFSKRYTFSFTDNTVRTGEGFERQNHRGLDKKGVLLSELGDWC
jgi:hypothetical protein